jgi:gamma-glutamyltranspeptidase/glutathione hydrolase
MTTTVRTAALLACLLVIVGCRSALPPSDRGSATTARPAAAQHAAGIAAANPIAVDAGLAILRQGGSAVDAAVAVQAALGLVEPQSSGLGGGAFMLYYDATSGRITSYDGRETAPAGATADMFLDERGQPLSYADAVTSGRATGVPGAIAMLGVAHDQHGRLPWSRLFESAARTAEDGFPVPRRLARFANSNFPQASLPDARALFGKPDGTTIQAGETFRNPAYAASLRAVAARGPRALLEPPLSDAIMERTHAEPRPGTLARGDFAAYQPREREPICRTYRIYVICVPPPPSSGVALLQMLAMLEHTDIDQRGPDDPQAWFLFAEASRLMYADRDRYVADPAFVAVPVDGLLDPAYVAGRASLIGEHAGPPPAPGEPPSSHARFGDDATLEAAGTSHFVIVDSAGDIVSMTTTVESIFGSGRAVDGFFLNNQLTDFSFRPVQGDRPAANSVAPGKRPRSSMAPIIVLDSRGRPYAALGSPGGTSILVYNAKTLVAFLDWHLPLQKAIDLPNLFARGKDYYGEVGKFPREVLAGLAARGIELKSGRGEESGVQGVVFFEDGRLEGAADPRREGVWRQP